MAAVYWMGGVSARWNKGYAWSDGEVPTSSDDVTIAATGTYMVSVTKTAEANSLLLDEATATLAVGANAHLAVGATLDLAAGTLEVAAGGELSAGALVLTGGSLVLDGGTVSGGVIDDAGGVFVTNGGTLDGVTFEGTIDLSARGGTALYIGPEGLIVTGAGGKGKGVIQDTGEPSELYFEGNQTFNNATIDLGGPAEAAGIYADDTTGSGATLTLGRHLTVDVVAFDVVIGDVRGDETIVNEGQIDLTKANYAGAAISLSGFVNAGDIKVLGAGLSVGCSNLFENTAGATLTVASGSTLTIRAPTISNAGTISASGATLSFDGTLTTADLDNVGDPGGEIAISGTLNNTGATLAVGAGTPLGTLSSKSVIVGGVITDAGSGFSSYGTLEGVAYEGTLDLSTSTYDTATILGGLTVTGPGGVGRGTLEATGSNNYSASLYFDATQTIDNFTIDLGGANAASVIYNEGDLLTFGSQLIINQAGKLAELQDNFDAGAQTVNEGMIAAGFSGGKFSIVDGVFSNQGVVDVSNGDTLLLQPKTFSNLVKTTLTGGTYEVDAGSTLQLSSKAAVTVDDATVVLSGPGSVFEGLFTIDATLTDIGVGGALDILAGRDWTSTRVLDNAGGMVLGGGTLSAAGLVDTAGSTLTGFGVVTSPFTNDGLVEAVSGTLELTGQVTGAGAIAIGAAATMELTAAVAAGLTAVFDGAGGTLSLADPTDFAATIAGFASGETIDLLRTAATGASINADDQLVIVNGTSTVATLQLTGSYAGDTVVVSPDGNQGSDITLSPGSHQEPVIAPHVPGIALFVEQMSAVFRSGAPVGFPPASAQGELGVRTLLSAPRCVLA